MIPNKVGCKAVTPIHRRMQKRGELSDLNMYWSWHRALNFGDWIGPFLFRKITGVAPVHCRIWGVEPPSSVYFTCGSIFRKIKKPDVAIVWGSGTMDADTSPARPKKTLALRGPLSQQRFDQLGFDVPDVIGDPGICLPFYYKPSVTTKKYRLGILPHGFDLQYWRAVELPDDVKLITVNRDVEDVIDDIVQCEAIASSSLHGLIEAHAYGIPATWIGTTEATLIGDGTKFHDYHMSIGLGRGHERPADHSILKNISEITASCYLPDVDITAMAERLMSVCPFDTLSAQAQNRVLDRRLAV